MAKQVFENVDICQDEEVQHRLADWDSEIELDMINQFRDALAKLPSDILGKSTAVFTKRFRNFKDAMKAQHSKLSMKQHVRTL